MRAILFFMIVIVSSSQALAANSEQIISKAVSKLASLFSDGLATRVEEPRPIKFGSLFSHGDQDAVAYFVLEGIGGGNGTAEYLAFFESVEYPDFSGRSTKRYRLTAVSQIGGRGWRTFDWESGYFKQRSLLIKGKQWVSGKDAMCCPSLPISIVFKAGHRGVTEDHE